MRYYQAQNEPYVAQYVGDKYQPKLFLKAGQILEDRFNQAEAANQKFQATGELTPGRFAPKDAELFNAKTREIQERARKAAMEGRSRDLQQALYEGQSHLTSAIANKIQRDFENTTKYVTPELMKEGDVLFAGDDTDWTFSNLIPDEAYKGHRNTFQSESENYAKDLKPEIQRTIQSEFVVDPTTGEYTDKITNKIYDKESLAPELFGRRFANVVDEMGNGLENYQSFHGIPYEIKKNLSKLSSEKGSAKNETHPDWSEKQQAIHERGLNYMSKYFQDVIPTYEDFTKLQGQNGNSGGRRKKETILEAPSVESEQFAASQETGFSPNDIKTHYDFTSNLKKVTAPENVYADVIKKYTTEETAPVLIEMLKTRNPEAVAKGIASVLDENQENAFLQEFAEAKYKNEELKSEMENVQKSISEKAKQGLKLDKYLDENGDIVIPKELEKEVQKKIYFHSDPDNIDDQKYIQNRILADYEDSQIANPEIRKELINEYNNLREEYKGQLNSISFKKAAIELYNRYVDEDKNYKLNKLSQEELNKFSKNESNRIIDIFKSDKTLGEYYTNLNKYTEEHFNDPKLKLQGWIPSQYGIQPKGNSAGQTIQESVEQSIHVLPHINPKTGKPLKEGEIKQKIYKKGDSPGTISFIGVRDTKDAVLFKDPANGRFMMRYAAYPTKEDMESKQNMEYEYVDVTDIAKQTLADEYPDELEAFDRQHEFWQNIKHLDEGERTLDKVFKVGITAPQKEMLSQFKIEERGNSYFINGTGSYSGITLGKARNEQELLNDLFTLIPQLGLTSSGGGKGMEISPEGKDLNLQYLE